MNLFKRFIQVMGALIIAAVLILYIPIALADYMPLQSIGIAVCAYTLLCLLATNTVLERWIIVAGGFAVCTVCLLHAFPLLMSGGVVKIVFGIAMAITSVIAIPFVITFGEKVSETFNALLG